MPMEIPEWRNVDRHLFETQILPAGRPAVFKGAVDDWPLVQRRTDSLAAIIDYLKSFNPATQVEWIAGRARDIDLRRVVRDLIRPEWKRSHAAPGRCLDARSLARGSATPRPQNGRSARQK
jgi:hypothetical protein